MTAPGGEVDASAAVSTRSSTSPSGCISISVARGSVASLLVLDCTKKLPPKWSNSLIVSRCSEKKPSAAIATIAASETMRERALIARLNSPDPPLPGLGSLFVQVGDPTTGHVARGTCTRKPVPYSPPCATPWQARALRPALPCVRTTPACPMCPRHGPSMP